MKFLIVLLWTFLISNAQEASSLCKNNYGKSYCSYIKQIDINLFLNKTRLHNSLLIRLDVGLNQLDVENSGDDDDDDDDFNFSLDLTSRINDDDYVLRTYTSEIIYIHTINGSTATTAKQIGSVFDKQLASTYVSLNRFFLFRLLKNYTIEIKMVNFDADESGSELNDWKQAAANLDYLYNSLVDKSLRFKLKHGQSSSCYLTLDFYDRERYERNNLELIELIDLEKKTFIYYEAYWLKHDVRPSNFTSYMDSQEEKLFKQAILSDGSFQIDLKRVINGWCDQKYALVCIKCSPDMSLTILANDVISLRFDEQAFKDQAHFDNFAIMVEDELENSTDKRRSFIYVRLFYFNENEQQLVYDVTAEEDDEDHIDDEAAEHRRVKRQSRRVYSSLTNNNNNNNGPIVVNKNGGGYGNPNLLRVATISIDEETIGLQTKTKIYDHTWSDYYINASDYVRQRIALISPDNPILNITEPFDYETGGALHNFQIIFTRKADKRTIREVKPISIKVNDVNDEPPVWKMDEPVPYTAVVNKDPAPNQLIFQFLAEDPDTNSEIVYRLHSKSPDTHRFVLKDGKLLTEPGGPLQYETYKILVSAYDAKAISLMKASTKSFQSNKSQEIFAELTVRVGKLSPQFYKQEYRVNISENEPIGFNIIQVRAKSFFPDPGNRKHLKYSLLTDQMRQSDQFSIYSENGTVLLARKVDYETDLREYNLQVFVTEQSGQMRSSSVKLTIFVEDYNDNAPQFTLSEYVRNQAVPEDIIPNTFIIQVEVQDRDSGLNSEIEWEVSNPNFYVKPVSSTDTARAKIYNKNKLDYEIPQHMYRFDVFARDKGNPSLNASAKVSVPISNVNDEKPKFDQKLIYAYLDENVPSGAYVTTIQATDGDGDRIFFKLKDESGPFEINRDSGIVKVKADRRIDPREDSYNLTVYAEDDGSCCCHTAGNGHHQHSAGNRVHLKNSISNANCKAKTNLEEATLIIRIRDINDHAPEFHECESYSRSAQVEEEKPVGTNVIRVEAIDRDKGENGAVEYEILSTHTNERNALFKIDPNTGQITTNTVFDRESSAKINEFSITVKAKDKGKPHPLSDACSFRIKILDINDHAPTFYETEYKLSMKYGTQPGQNIQRLIATDLDSGKNAEIKYRIKQDGKYAQYFNVDELTGMISLKKEIPHANKRPISFELVAEDGGSPPRSSSVPVNVIFADRDNEPPKWLPETEKRFERTVRIPEAISLNQVVETLDAESNYAPNSKLIFDFSPKPDPESFIIQQEKIPGTNRYRGKIIVYQPLDAETQSFYQLNVRVQNAAAQPMEIIGVVKVEILDSNDNIPLFTSPTYLANVSENSPPGTYVTKVTAEDKDISAPNNVVLYTISDQEYNKKFQIDQYTGNITTRVPLDREEIKVYFIDVTACDSAMSDRPNMNTPNCRTANVRIDVSDKNDNEPFFNSSMYETTVSEDAERGTPIITIQANDLDENSQLRYIITDGNEENVFAVRESIGEIYVASNGKLDFETLDQYLLTLTVSDGIHNATTKVRINLLDVNDNPPIFTEPPPYDLELLEEDGNVPRVILIINATDGDTKRNKPIVYKINYNYTQNGTSFRPFAINAQTGEIVLQSKLDRDYPYGRATWSFNVIASDEGGAKGSMDSTAVVNIKLLDINDNAPVFDKPPYVGHILENSKPGSLIMTVTANDYDDPNTGQNAVLRYQIAENKKFGNLDVFSINDTTGQIYQNIALDREQIDKYTIEVCASDGSGKRGCGQVNIYVDDANDQAPMFQSSTYTETINEDWPVGERVLVVTATDKDQGINAELSYGLKSECLVKNSIYTGDDQKDCVDGVREPKYFKVDTEREANSGFVKLAKSVNYDPPDFHRLFKLNVSVSDGVSQNFTTVFINIADVNDEAPQFKEPVKNIQISEAIPPFTIITNFSAEDLDTNEINKRFTYSLDRKSEGSHEFTIDQNGNLYNLEPLDRETKDKYILRIFAIDEGFPPQTGIATLNLEISDINDNYPIFAENYRPVVMENTEPNQFVIKVKAKDLDNHESGAAYSFELPDQMNRWPADRNEAKFNMSVVPSNDDTFAKIYTMVSFDREGANCRSKSDKPNPTLSPAQLEYEQQHQCKEFKIPIIMKDNGKPPMSGINYLTVTIGDVNDNLHVGGVKRIYVYDYKGSVMKKTTIIGTVFADDKDDWDMSDKEFKFVDETEEFIRNYFDVVESVSDLRFGEHNIPGSILLKPGIKVGTYEFRVNVKDLTRPDYEAQMSTVIVLVKTVNDDLVQNSGSIRLSGINAERLVDTRYSPNERSMLNEIQNYLALSIFKLSSVNNLEFFSVMNHKSLPNTVDLRYSAHGSPIYRTERVNGLLAHNRTQFQQMLTSLDSHIQLVAVGIDECVESERRCRDGGCKSHTQYLNVPAVVNGNKTSIVGVTAIEQAECVCKSLQGFALASLSQRSCSDSNYCLNGGVCVKHGAIQKCQCLKGFDGPRCQKTIRHFNNGFAWLPVLPQCQDLVISLEFVTMANKGLIFYNGPINGGNNNDKANKYQDFMALQLDRGRVIFYLKQGINGKTLSYTFNNYDRILNDGSWHRIDIYKSNFKYRITIDRCIEESATTDQRTSHRNHNQNTLNTIVNGCEYEIQIQIHDLFVNVNQYYPLQLGGVYERTALPKTLDYRGNFLGCIRNFKVNGEFYDLQLDTYASIGFHQNTLDSCPRAEKNCNRANETDYCVNGVCNADFHSAECVCKPGYRGRNCELRALPFDFQPTSSVKRHLGSYLKYRYVYNSDTKNSAYDYYLRKFTKVQLLFRTRENTTDRVQTLFQITSPNRAQYVYLEVGDNRLQFRYDIGSGETLLVLSKTLVNDGKWHFARAERYGKEASLTLDDGEGFKSNYTFGLPNGVKEMDVDRDSIFLGAKVAQIKVSGFEVSRDFHDSCMMDVRFDDKPLPYTQLENELYEEVAIKMDSVNVQDGCPSVDYCKGIICTGVQKCVDQWRLGECQCPAGQQLNGSRCESLNDCQLCSREGTRYCEKYDDNRIIAYENFYEDTYQHHHHQQHNDMSIVGDYPPNFWYLSRDFTHELGESRKLWKLTPSGEDTHISGHKCVCKKGYHGPTCSVGALSGDRRAIFMSLEAISIIVLCLIVFLVMVLIFVAYSKSKRPTPKHYMLGVDPNDEVRETIINYVEEGCPDVDQSAYDITQLAKPLDPSSMGTMSSAMLASQHHHHHHPNLVVDGEFQPAVPKQKPPLQDISLIRRDVPPVIQLNGVKAHRLQNNDVGDFINNKLREIDNDPLAPPYDSVQEYLYEGEGSMYGSTLSSLEIKQDNNAAVSLSTSGSNVPSNKLTTFSSSKRESSVDNENGCDSDLECVKNWGPKFNKLSNLYGLKSDE